MYRYSKISIGIFASFWSAFVFDQTPISGWTIPLLLNAMIPGADDGWFMGLFGLGIGVIFIPWVLNLIERDREYQKYYDESHSPSLGKARSKYFMYLSRAYEAWRNDKQNVPSSIQELIRIADFPSWLPVLKGSLAATVDSHYGDHLPPLWQFSRDLSEEIDGFIRRRTPPKLLSEQEIERFHDARQELGYFWNHKAVMLLRYRKLRFRNMKNKIEQQENSIKSLGIFAIEWDRTIRREGEGP